jgi:hypothetical protein
LRHEAALVGDISAQQIALLEDAYENARKSLKPE